MPYVLALSNVSFVQMSIIEITAKPSFISLQRRCPEFQSCIAQPQSLAKENLMLCLIVQRGESSRQGCDWDESPV